MSEVMGGQWEESVLKLWYMKERQDGGWKEAFSVAQVFRPNLQANEQRIFLKKEKREKKKQVNEAKRKDKKIYEKLQV